MIPQFLHEQFGAPQEPQKEQEPQERFEAALRKRMEISEQIMALQEGRREL